MTATTPTDDGRVAIARSRSAGTRRTVIAWVVGIGLLAAAVAGVGALTLLRKPPAAPPAAPGAAIESTATGASALVSSTAAAAALVEVPQLVGLGREEALLVLQAAGLVASISTDGSPTASASRVLDQEPTAGELAEANSIVRVTVSAGQQAAPASAKGGKAVASKKPARQFVVCIDPGHQAHSDTGLEPLGPGSPEMRTRVSGGTSGASTCVPEYEIALQLATNLQRRLETAGVKVVMTRTTNDVDVSNAERAAIANGAKSDLFVRVHADSSTDPALCGVSTLYPAGNAWTQPVYDSSKRAAARIENSLVRVTGAVDRGAIERSDLAGFNWSKVPSVLVQTGFLSNSVEDKLLTSPQYQDKIAEGIAGGVLAYLNGAN